MADSETQTPPAVETPEDAEDEAFSLNYGMAIALGLPFGAIFGMILFDNLALGAAFGLALAPVVALMMNKANA